MPPFNGDTKILHYFCELLRLPFSSFNAATIYETSNNYYKNKSTYTSSNVGMLFRNFETYFVTELVNLEVEFIFIFISADLVRSFVNINGCGF